MTSGALKEGDRVQTDLGPGTVVLIWHDVRWAFGIPKRSTYLTVEMDGDPGWRRVYAPDQVDLLEAGVDWPA